MENEALRDVLTALDEFLVYRTESKLEDLARARQKLRLERENTHAGQACRHVKDFATVAR